MLRKCPHCKTPSSSWIRFGSFFRRSDRKWIIRYRCKGCKRTFSNATFQAAVHQNKRFLNPIIQKYLVSAVSKRRIALLLKISRSTVDRKAEFLGLQERRLNSLMLNHGTAVSEFQFDDLETFEHTKLKPLSVIMAVERHSRRIIGFRVSKMPAKGLLVKRALKKYGPREDERPKGREALFLAIQGKVATQSVIWSDQSPHYPTAVKTHFPMAQHKTCKGRRGCVVGQGELKAGGFDPLFSLNHTFAMLRANVNRLARRTWCTTKKPENLVLHLDLYAHYHNTVLIKSKDELKTNPLGAFNSKSCS